MSLKKIAIVTGASRGLGKNIAKKLSKNGIVVIGTATTKLGAEHISKYLNNNGIGIQLNLSDLNSINDSMNHIYKRFKFIDILINNAGIIKDKLFINMTIEDWNNVLNVNLNATFHILQSVIKKMIKRRKGKIISIGSTIGHIGNCGQTNYAASKSGLIGFYKSLALEVAHKGITVNMIAPGIIETDMTYQLNEKQKINYLSKIPMRRFGTQDEISEAVYFLTSDYANYITGQILHINGGMYMP